ncbi:MAG TPA: DUF6266 family protein [Lentimicrobium sp.]|nr:DUF6266 family protein [Lentimicrobium sp.]
MATYKQGFLGAFSGKLGNVIGTFWKGISVMRVVPANVANPNTLAQQTHRTKFRLLTQFLSANSKFFRIGFGALDSNMSEYNAAFKANFASAIAGTYPSLTIDVTKLIPSKGELPSLDGFAAESTVANTVALSWTDNSSAEGATGADKINMAVFDEATGESVTILQGADRIDETATINLPLGWSGKKVSVYAFLNTESGISRISKASQVSDPVHVSGITVA